MKANVPAMIAMWFLAGPLAAQASTLQFTFDSVVLGTGDGAIAVSGFLYQDGTDFSLDAGGILFTPDTVLVPTSPRNPGAVSYAFVDPTATLWVAVEPSDYGGTSPSSGPYSLAYGGTYLQYTNGQTFYLTGGTVVTSPAPTPVPEPATLSLLGLGLAGVGVMRRRKAA